MKSELRVGHGVDIHQLAEGRRCVLGGVEIPSDRGPIGHSDADVIIHALMDALLGAAGETDIGTHFPNTDPRWKNADSIKLLGIVWDRLSGQGWQFVNCDICAVCEMPKLKPHIAGMKEQIAIALGTEIARIGIKATTAERLGAIGRGEGIFASATVLIQR